MHGNFQSILELFEGLAIFIYGVHILSEGAEFAREMDQNKKITSSEFSHKELKSFISYVLRNYQTALE